MAGITRKLAFLGLLTGLTAAGWAQGPWLREPKPRAARTIAKSQPPAAQPPSQSSQPQSVEPQRPEQMAPVAPQVTYRDGQLSIQAQNSTLSSILAAVRARTGARVEMPADTVSDRVAAQLGPGNPRDILAALLQGSRFDYIVIGTLTDPDALSAVILTPHGSGGSAPADAGSSPSPVVSNPQPTMPGGGVVAGRPEINSDDEETAAESQPPPPPPPAQIPPQGVINAEQPAPPNPDDASQQQKPNQVKTPEQLLQELQRMQQQQTRQGRQPQQQ